MPELTFTQYAAVMGLNEDLKLVGNQFSNIATFLFVGLLCFEVPNSQCPLPPFVSCDGTEKLTSPLLQSGSSRWFQLPSGWAST